MTHPGRAPGQTPGTCGCGAVLVGMGKPPRSTPGKKPPAPAGSSRRAAVGPDVRAQIVGEIYIALERLGTDAELLAIVGSWRDTLGDHEVLAMLRDYNAGRPTLHRGQ